MSRLLSNYGMLAVLLVLAAMFSVLTVDRQAPSGAASGRQLAARLAETLQPDDGVLIVVRPSDEECRFAEALRDALEAGGYRVVDVVSGDPADARRALVRVTDTQQPLAAIACSPTTADWSVFEDLGRRYPGLGDVRLVRPESTRWPNFLKRENLINVANQIAVIAILAIGMTMVIITGGIDLSVGSLIALSAVVTTALVRDVAGANQATALGMVLCSVGGIAACAAVGAFSGVMVTAFRIPPFIVTLAMMLVASGLAYLLSQGQSIHEVPDGFISLGRGQLAGIPNAVLLMVVLYAVAHVVMSQTIIGRYIYAVGGNVEAARLSGVPVKRVVLFVYLVGGELAGLGGVITASQLKAGSPTYGQMYELYVIAAVVVGGTSLSGGEGRILGTLIGALIIAVIQNGMNLIGVESYTQKVILGAVILAAVLLDTLKRRRG
ncbi:MAG: ABC transporter permease [Planctomycetia bacterium]|nr:ABC transporter permease [Planctomycetia bacterium]